MKKILFIGLLIFINLVQAQTLPTKEVKTKVDEVTVFLREAQITRNKTIHLSKGKSIIKFINLSPFIDKTSIRVDVKGEITVLSVNHQQNFVDKLHKPKQVVDFENKIKELDKKTELLEAKITVLNEQKSFLKANKDIGGNQTLSVQNISQTLDFYSKKMNEISLKEIEINHKIDEIAKKRKDLYKQLKIKIGKKDFSRGEIWVKVDVARAMDFKFKISYIVGNAGWFPSYDIRASRIDRPLKLIYKAKVKQDTKVDWDNVKLKFSSVNTKISNASPKLIPYYLDYYSSPPTYDTFNKTSFLSKGMVTGTVLEASTGDAIPGVNVIIKGTNMGAATDFDGNFSILVPQGRHQLEFSAVGYETKVVNVNSSHINISLNVSSNELQEVVVYALGVKGKNKNKFNKYKEMTLEEDVYEEAEEKPDNIALPFKQEEKPVGVDFKIDIPYTVKSDNQVYTIDMVTYKVPADYQYYSVPKIVEKAYLLASITDWEKYNLLQGEANIFFNNAFIGKTILDVSKIQDTLTLSLGSDKNISIKRKKIKDFSSKQFIGNKKLQTFAWKILVKNNKSVPVDIEVMDQIPVPKLKEIKLEVLEISGAKYNDENGELKWKLKLNSGQTKELLVKYSLKYPKYRQLRVD